MYVRGSVADGSKSWTCNSKAPSPSPEITFSWKWSNCVAANVDFSVVYVVWTDTRPVIKTLYIAGYIITSYNMKHAGCIF